MTKCGNALYFEKIKYTEHITLGRVWRLVMQLGF